VSSEIPDPDPTLRRLGITGPVAEMCATRWRAGRARYGPGWQGLTRPDGSLDYLVEAVTEALDGLNCTAAHLAAGAADPYVREALDHFALALGHLRHAAARRRSSA